MFQFYVKLRIKRTGFFAPPGDPGFLSGLTASDAGVIPQFGGEPVRYSVLASWFVKTQLRRAGYNVSTIPCLLARVLARLQRQRRMPKWWRK